MEPKSGLEIALSPEFLMIMPFAVVIDIIGIILVIFGLDDFWTTDIIAWIFIGGWSFFRSQVVPAPTDVQMPSYSEQQGKSREKIKKLEHASQVATGKADEAAKAANLAKGSGDMEKAALETKRAQKFSKAAKTAKNLKWLEFIPYVGALPLWSVSVYMTIKYS